MPSQVSPSSGYELTSGTDRESSPLAPRPSPLAPRHSPLATRHSPLSLVDPRGSTWFRSTSGAPRTASAGGFRPSPREAGPWWPGPCGGLSRTIAIMSPGPNEPASVPLATGDTTLAKLQTQCEGLPRDESREGLSRFGPNALAEHPQDPLLSYFWGPIPWRLTGGSYRQGRAGRPECTEPRSARANPRRPTCNRCATCPAPYPRR
jgi:Cation transporter/ATPase, N-terminus